MTKWYNFCYRHSWLAAIGLAIVLVVVAALTAGCQIQTSGTPQPNCPFGQHVERAPSHQGVVWQCVKG